MFPTPSCVKTGECGAAWANGENAITVRAVDSSGNTSGFSNEFFFC